MRAVDDHRGLRVDNTRSRIVDEIRGHERLFFVTHDADQRSFLGFRLEQGVHLFHRRRALGLENDIRQRPVDERHAHRESVQFTLEFRNDELHRRGAPRGRRRQVYQPAPRPSQIILLRVRRVHHRLRVRHVMHRRYASPMHPDLLMNRVNHRRDAIRRARRRRHHSMLLRVVLPVIHPVHHVQRPLALHRRRHHHLLHRHIQAIDML